jgi:glutamate racemase
MQPLPENREHPAAEPVIGIIDSGVGGLSIFDALKARLPQATYAYAFDNAHFPYGTRSGDDVAHLTVKLAQALNRVMPLDLLVVACNTASTVALAALREALPIPVVGVVPAIKPAALRSVTKVIGLLATPATVDRSYTDDLIRQFASGVKVVKVGSSDLVFAAEAKFRGESLAPFDLAGAIRPFLSDAVDYVVLGCTHFPLLRDEFQLIAKTAGRQVTWVDSGDAISSRVVELLSSPGTFRTPKQPWMAFATARSSDISVLQAAFSRRGFKSLDVLSTLD